MLANNNLQILNINKSDEGIYRCEGRVEARGEIDFRDIIVIVNGKQGIICMYFVVAFSKGNHGNSALKTNKPLLSLEEIASPIIQHLLLHFSLKDKQAC